MAEVPVAGVGLRIAASPAPQSRDDAAARATALASIGYAVLPADHRCDARERTHWLHRHVAVIVDGALTDAGRAWLRDLSLASPRAHLVIPTGSVRASDVVARERAPALVDWSSQQDDRRVRSQRRFRVSRPGAGLAWLRAAVGAAARRPDEAAHADALVAYGQVALRVGARTELVRVQSRCREALRQMTALGPRSRVVAMAGEVLCRLGDGDVATAWRHGVEVECALTGVDVPPWIVVQEADQALWEGRWDDAQRAIGSLPEGLDDRVGRSALVAWLRQDAGALRRVCATAPDRGSTPWGIVARLIAAAVRRDVPAAVDLAESATDTRATPWQWGVACEVLRHLGLGAEAARVLARRRQQRDRPLRDEAFLAQLAGDARAAALIARCGAHGITRWGERRELMSTWGGVAMLLEEVNNADDDRTALRRGCRWVRVHTGTAHVVVLAAETGAVVLAEPEGATPADDDVRAPIRQGGVTIGWVAAGRRARDAEELAGCVRALAAVAAPSLRACLDVARLAQSGETIAADLLGQSPAMVALWSAIARAAPTTFPVLIEGESGVGKELVARAVHRLSPRRDRRLAAVNCAALTDELFEAEVFGHTRGAFTGAVGARTGLLEDAHQGTVFLDEVGELSPRAQAKLLRVLQEGEVRRVGDNQPRAIDVRIVAATNRPLAEAVAAGTYREDLLFRLAVVRLRVPPLRERLEDVPGLAQTFWTAAVRHRETRAWLAPDALAALCRHRWPGNVRELQNVIASLVLAAPDRGRVTARHVASVLVAQDGPASEVSLDAARRALDRRLVTAALARHEGCRAAAARDLGVSRQGLGKLMARLERSV